MAGLGERIREVRGERQLIDFARDLGIHKNTLLNYEKGDRRSPDADLLLKVLELRPTINPTWLLTGEGQKEKFDISMKSEGMVCLPACSNRNDKVWEFSADNHHQFVDFVEFKEEWLQAYLQVPKEYLALMAVEGDSMKPTLEHGDLVLVDLRVNRPAENSIYVLAIEDSLLVKRVQLKMDGSIVIKSDNPLYDAEILGLKERERLKIRGQVVWYGKKV